MCSCVEANQVMGCFADTRTWGRMCCKSRVIYCLLSNIEPKQSFDRMYETWWWKMAVAGIVDGTNNTLELCRRISSLRVIVRPLQQRKWGFFSLWFLYVRAQQQAFLYIFINSNRTQKSPRTKRMTRLSKKNIEDVRGNRRNMEKWVREWR